MRVYINNCLVGRRQFPLGSHTGANWSAWVQRSGTLRAVRKGVGSRSLLLTLCWEEFELASPCHAPSSSLPTTSWDDMGDSIVCSLLVHVCSAALFLLHWLDTYISLESPWTRSCPKDFPSWFQITGNGLKRMLLIEIFGSSLVNYTSPWMWVPRGVNVSIFAHRFVYRIPIFLDSIVFRSGMRQLTVIASLFS